MTFTNMWRKGYDPSPAADFNNFIYEANLAEYCMNGFKFTRWLDGGNKLNKLDRMLVCERFWGLWPTASLRALPRELSDHCPLILTTTSTDSGHIPFKFFNAWLSKPGLDELVRSTVCAFVFTGPLDLFLAEKLRRIKEAIKSWNKANRRKEGKVLNASIAEIHRLDLICECTNLTESEATSYLEHKKIVSSINDDRLKDRHQKSRIKWAIGGDENSAFFHGYINSRISKSRLNGLLIDGVWCNV
ncbi:uncharacterized protein LOC110901921 [Helianthus annuus]|uniref:uncharacterized protein LOC110901921 n=1 Tax=Helianthus annuus TaxID=4232 RepID=UPI000B8F126F|nr:uncharacterized protein LOC110901921 [Helianthus annuus]